MGLSLLTVQPRGIGAQFGPDFPETRTAVNDDVVSPFPRSMAKVRLAFYAVLGLSDLSVLLLTSVLVQIQFRNANPGLDLAQILTFAFIANRNQCYGADAILQQREGAARAALSMAMTSLVILAMAKFLGSTTVGLRLLACQTAYAMLGVYVMRKVAVTLFNRFTGGICVNEMILVDSPTAQPLDGRTTICAQKAGLDPTRLDPDFLNRLGILLKDCDRVVIDTSQERRRLWLEALRGIDVDVEISMPEFSLDRPLEMRTMNGQQTLLMRQGALTTSMRFQKRALDLAIASTALILLSPIMLVLAIAIPLDSPGSIIFRQARVGRGNRQFQVLKFRTMYQSCSDDPGGRARGEQKDGVTWLGRFMRGTSLDELPQLINVLRGDMSIVGPRPHALASRAGDALFWDVDQRYWDRHAIKPGMTGLAQVRGLRGPTPTMSDLQQRLVADIEYLAKWSLLTDLFIIVRTITVLVHRNAK